MRTSLSRALGASMMPFVAMRITYIRAAPKGYRDHADAVAHPLPRRGRPARVQSLPHRKFSNI